MALEDGTDWTGVRVALRVRLGVALAVAPTLFSAKVPYLSNNAGPSQFAGAQCSPFFFGTAYQNDQFHEAAGKFAD